MKRCLENDRLNSFHISVETVTFICKFKEYLPGKPVYIWEKCYDCTAN